MSASRISGNLDAPEGGFDAMMQAIVCGVSIFFYSQCTCFERALFSSLNFGGKSKAHIQDRLKKYVNALLSPRFTRYPLIFLNTFC